MRRLLRRPDAGHGAPRLSVVVPAYNVEQYLADCLTSILRQSFRDLEVVVVDDGSTDATGEVADRVSRRDPRVRVVHQANAGLGAARNVGTQHCTAELLTFADSDDLLLDGAYERLVATLDRTGSDIAIGSVERLDGGRRFVTPLMRANHARPADAVTVELAPGMLADVFAWNKVFRRSFWDAADLSFPERVRYEDQPLLTRALVAAGSFDVLTEPVYLWRLRSDGSSISQGRHDLADLEDRMLTKRWSTDVVLDQTSAATQQVWFGTVLPIDMWEYFRAAPGCSDEFWSVLRDGLRELWNPRTMPFERTRLPLRQRLMGWLVAEDRRRDLGTLIAYLDEHPGGLPRRTVGDRELAVHPFSDDERLPVELTA